MTNQPEEAAQTPQHIRSVIITGHEYEVIPSEMAYHHSRSSIRQIYEEHFLGDEREVTVQRVVNVVNGGHGQEYDPGYAHEYWRGGPQNYQDAREYYDEGYYPPPDRRYLDDNPGYQRNSPPPRHDYYHQPGLGRHDLRHQLDSRNHSRPRPHHHYQARGRSSGSHQRSGPERKPHPGSLPATGKRGRSPSSRDQPPVNSSSRSFSPGKDQGPAHHQSSKKLKPNVAPSQTPGSSSSRSSVEESTHSSASSKNQLPEPATSPLNPEPLACQERSAASVAETSVKTVVEVEEEAAGVEEQGRREEEEEEEDDDEEEDEEEEVGAAGTEPKVSTEERVRARRADTIKAKALEITKLYTQDCETFRTVVKMLVAKEPRLDELLQASLDKNLLEIQEHCLDDLRQFVKELDQIIAQGRQVSNSDTLNPAWLARVVEVGEEGEDLPQISFKLEDSSPSRSAGDKSEKEKPGGGTEEPERGKVATPLPENGSFSTPAPSESPSFPAPSKRVQLYGAHGVKLKNNQLFNPKLWHSISCFRPGWVPDRLPFLHGDRYWELKASSTVVSTSPPPPYSKRPKGSKVPCGVTCYIHAEGPWCEIQAANGTRICILVAEPQNRRV